MTRVKDQTLEDNDWLLNFIMKIGLTTFYLFVFSNP